MNWLEYVGAAVAVVLLLWPLAGILVEWRGRKVFVPQGDFSGLGKKVGEMDKCQAGIREIADANRDRIALLEQNHLHQAERVSEMVVKPLERVVDRLDRIVETQEKHGILLARQEEGRRSLGLSLDLLRDQVNKSSSP